MSGIAGIYYPDGREVSSDDLERMIGRMLHRGPDRQSCWRNGNVGLGSALLETTAESCFEQLPCTDQKFMLTVTADARIDNRQELFKQLSLDIEETVPYSRLILAAYKKWGEQCANHLLGDFSFVVWDGIAEKLVLLS